MILNAQDTETFNRLSAAIAQLHTQPPPTEVLPSDVALAHAREKLVSELPDSGKGLEETIRHIQEELAPAFNASSRSPN